MCLKGCHVMLFSHDPAKKSLSLVPQDNNISNRSMDSFFRRLLRTYHISLSVVWFDSLVIMYYYVFAEIMTTVAHLCAIILGVLLWIST